ncbi:F-box only protein 7 [Cardamine amara subsp. amara]|uniref:F-box only protein 7 n=1 Tax=Cardamine amara subsp. amara TaxID=228776 RepID=A0ABD1AD69_CARAN
MSKNHQDWSKLCSDILQPILESLSSTDFHRAKIVCLDWYSVWKTCVRERLRPWQITYQGDSSILFDPKKDKSYETKRLSLYDKTYCMASSGNWILQVNSCFDFSILNLLTRKRIKLPSMKSEFLRKSEWEDIIRYKTSAILWINERTEDYVVAWIFKQHYLYSYKKGDNSWYNWKLNNDTCYFDMAYKNNNLYLYTLNHYIKILDVPGDSPKEGMIKPYWLYPFHYVEQPLEYIWKRRIAIQISEEVLIILSSKTEL